MKDFKLEIVYLPVDALVEYEGNARKHTPQDVEAIKRSIKQFGFDDPIGVWSEKNVIVEGHGRLQAAKELGMDTVPCIRLDHLTEEQRRAYGLAHNKTAELSSWDFGKLDLELKNLGNFTMSDFGFGFSGGLTPVQNTGDSFEPAEGTDEFRSYDAPVSDEELAAYEENADEFLAKRRIIITYYPEQEGALKELLGITDEKMRVVYDVNDFLGEEE